MMFLVICRRAPDGATDAFARLVADEGAVLRKLQAGGILTEAWSPGGPGAVLMLGLPDQAAAERITSEFPLARGRPDHDRGHPAAPGEFLVPHTAHASTETAPALTARGAGHVDFLAIVPP